VNLSRFALQFCLFAVGIVAASASPLISESELKRIEAEALVALKGAKLDRDRYYYAHLIAARELNAHGFKEKAREYFSKALALPTTESKSEPAIELFHDSLRRGDDKQARLDLELALKHTSDRDTKLYLKAMADGFLDRRADSNPLLDGLQGHPMLWKQIERLMRERHYSVALAMLDRDGFVDAPITDKVTYDLLSVLVNGTRAGQLLCEPTLAQYPDAYSYSIKICSLLASLKRSGRADTVKVAEVRKFFEREKVRKPELLSAIEDLPK
jgi:hypothetical protein